MMQHDRASGHLGMQIPIVGWPRACILLLQDIKVQLSRAAGLGMSLPLWGEYLPGQK